MHFSKKKSLEGSLLIFLFLFGIHSISVYSGYPDLGLGNLAMLIQFCLLLFGIYFTSTTTQIKIILAMSFIGIDYPLLLMPLLLLPKMILSSRSTNLAVFKKAHVALLIFLGYALLLIIPTSFIDFSPLNNIFWLLTYGSGIITFFYYSKFRYSQNDVSEVFDFIKKMIILQLGLVFIQGGIYYSFEPGDWGMGSFKDAHKVSLYALLLLLYYYLPSLVKRKISAKALFNVRNILGLALLALCLILVDGKIIYLCFAMAIVIFFVLLWWRKLKSKMASISFNKLTLILGVALLLILNLPILFSFYLSKVFNSQKSIEYYIDNYGGGGKQLGYKSKFYNRVFGVMLEEDPLLWTFGVGPGKLGSRASNTLAYDVLYKDSQKIPGFIPAHSTVWTKKYMTDLWSIRVSKEMKELSSTLANPFSGIVAIKAEMGIIGLIIFLITTIYFGSGLINTINKQRITNIDQWRMTMACFWFAVPLLAIIDNYMEKPQITLPLFLMTCILFNVENSSDNSEV